MDFIVYGIAAILIIIYQCKKDNERTDARDRDPSNTVKTDKWKREHGLL